MHDKYEVERRANPECSRGVRMLKKGGLHVIGTRFLNARIDNCAHDLWFTDNLMCSVYSTSLHMVLAFNDNHDDLRLLRFTTLRGLTNTPMLTKKFLFSIHWSLFWPQKTQEWLAVFKTILLLVKKPSYPLCIIQCPAFFSFFFFFFFCNEGRPQRKKNLLEFHSLFKTS